MPDKDALDNQLPKGWGKTTLGEVIEFRKGRKPSALSDEPRSDYIPYIDIEAFEKAQFKRYAKPEDGVIVGPEDILLVWDGARAGLVGMGIKGVLGSTLMAIRPVELNLDYLFLYLQSKFSEINTNTRGIGIPHIEPNFFFSLIFPLPPLPEQQRIVAKIEELFTQLDAGVAALKRAQAALKRYKASVLKAACEGQLVPQDPSEGSAQDLLGQIAAERRAKWEEGLRARGKDPKKEKYVEPEGPDTSELPELPEGWVWSKLGNLFIVSIGGTPSRSQVDYWGGNILWVSSSEVANLRIIDTREKITRSGLEHSNAKLYPPGTVLLAMIGEGKTRGQTAILDTYATTNQNVAGILVSETPIISEWVFYWFISQYEETRKKGSGGMQYALNAGRIRDFLIPVPPLAEQPRIVAEVEQRLSVAMSLESTLEQSLARAARLRQTILQRAFEGRLVPQDPIDEPADQLLARIQAARREKMPARQGRLEI